jgi:CheY-like chemotaxis protein
VAALGLYCFRRSGANFGPFTITSKAVFSFAVQSPTASSPKADRSRKPRVVLADDHALILKVVSQLLTAEFDVVDAVADGQSAVDSALRLDPDIVLLDISMPRLGGFDALQELRRRGSRARAVFLTMHDGDEFVAAAVQIGAHGYVLKSRLQPDLASALDHALAGRLFVPSLTSLLNISDYPVKHAAQFHTDEGGRLDEMARFVGGALKRGDAVVIAATRETRAGVAQRLAHRGVDVDGLTEKGRYVPNDSREMLSQFMRNGRPDQTLLAQSVGQLENIRLASAEGPMKQLTVTGDMAALLYQDGNPEGAVGLEQLWANLTADRRFFTVCGYSQSCFAGKAGPEFLSNVSEQHDTIVHSGKAFRD